MSSASGSYASLLLASKYVTALGSLTFSRLTRLRSIQMKVASIGSRLGMIHLRALPVAYFGCSMYVRPYGQWGKANTEACQYPAVKIDEFDLDTTVDIRAGAHSDYGNRRWFR